MRSAVVSIISRTASTWGSSISWTAMKWGPTTFQWTCLSVSARSLSECSRMRSTSTTRTASSFDIPGTV